MGKGVFPDEEGVVMVGKKGRNEVALVGVVFLGKWFMKEGGVG